MASWLKAWGKPAESGMGGTNHGGDDGMMTDAEMTELRDSDGGAAQKLYLEGMLAHHHQGAVTMARAEIANGKNPDAVELAKRIVSSQSAEITTIRGMLARM